MKSMTENIAALFKAYNYEIILGLCALFLMYVITTAMKEARSKFPPGPMGLPLLGYLPFLTNDLHLDFMKLGEKYGDVFCVKLGSQKFVVLHGAEAIREAFNKPEFLGRPTIGPLAEMVPNSPFFNNNIPIWKEQRKFLVQCMRNLGLGKTQIEEHIMSEVNHFVKTLSGLNGQPTDIKMALTPSMSNNISAFIFGKRFDYDNPDRRLMDVNLDAFAEFFSHIPVVFLFPWIEVFPSVLKNLIVEAKNPAVGVKNLNTFFKQEVEAHEKTLDHGHVRDYIDRYLLEIKSHKENEPQTSFNYNIMLGSIFDIFVGGSESVRTTILWFIYCMAAFPDIQKKVYEEIKEALGSEKNPEFQDLKNLPYTHSVMLEIMRWKTILPLSLLHCTVADSTVGGYNIPKDTIVIANFWNVHHDPRYWEEPEHFKPERFITKDGKSVVKSSNLMTFSLGKRVCPGEFMAQLEVFLYFTAILQKFEVAFPPGVKVDFAAKFAMTFKLDPFLVLFLPRD